jgi:hypothetical protein
MQRGVDQGFDTDTIYATTARSLIAEALHFLRYPEV